MTNVLVKFVQEEKRFLIELICLSVTDEEEEATILDRKKKTTLDMGDI